MKRFMLVLVSMVTLCLAIVSQAAVIVYQDGADGVPGGLFLNWADPGGLGTLTGTDANAGDGNGVAVPGQLLAGRIDANIGPGGGTEAFYTTVSSTAAKSFTMAFYSYASLPDVSLRLYMQANTFTWYYDIPSVVLGWNSVAANMYHLDYAGNPVYNLAGWYSEGGRTAGDFPGDLVSGGGVSRIGFELTYPTANGQVYGFDNFALYDEYIPVNTPEPQTYVVLGFALLSLGIVFRKQFHTLVGAKATASR